MYSFDLTFGLASTEIVYVTTSLDIEEKSEESAGKSRIEEGKTLLLIRINVEKLAIERLHGRKVKKLGPRGEKRSEGALETTSRYIGGD